MPLPIGHAAIGFATHSILSYGKIKANHWRVALFVVILSNLPDIDVLFGLILQNNGSAFHRGPTHSIVFALLAGLLAAKLPRWLNSIPALPFKTCFLIIFSHVAADHFLTTSPVSFFWPLDVNWSTGSAGWRQVFHSVFFEAVQDAAIVFVCMVAVMTLMVVRRLFEGRIRWMRGS